MKTRKVAEIKFEIIDNKVCTFIDGKRTSDNVPNRSNLIFERIRRKRDKSHEYLKVTKQNIQRILDTDEEILREQVNDEFNEFMLSNDHLEFSNFYIKKVNNVRKQIDKKLIENVLYEFEKYVIQNEEKRLINLGK